ncbi:MAG: hypothetical protein J3K34DRAFT_460176 [Monoraphidium minutum]|nr:MAG: hypothetical protein J3K34DRAFT_460176 [Monoraphidium minutum]
MCGSTGQLKASGAVHADRSLGLPRAFHKAACCVVLIATAARGLYYTASTPPHTRCLLGPNVADRAPCDYSIALAAVALAGCAALLAATLLDFAIDAALHMAEAAATQAAGRHASLGFRAYECYKCVRFVCGDWVLTALFAAGMALGVLWWLVGVAVIASCARRADDRGLAGGGARQLAAGMAGAGLATQVLMLSAWACGTCCAAARAARGGGGAGAAAAGVTEAPEASRQQPLLPDAVRMPPHPCAAPVGGGVAVMA